MNRFLPAPRDLRINLLASPTALTLPLSFSWRPDASSADTVTVQTAYRITVAVGRANALRECYLYDSGKILSDASVAITPHGLSACLEANASQDVLYVAQVAIWDEADRESPLSEPVPFTLGIKWGSTEAIWAPIASGATEPDDFAFFRHTFSLSPAEAAAIDRAYLSVAATSPEPSRQYVYSLTLDGISVGVGPSRYGKTPDGTVILHAQTYDVTPLLTAGTHAIGAVCYALVERGFLCRLTVYDREGQAYPLAHSTTAPAAWAALSGDAVFGKDNSIGTHYFRAHACNMDAALFPFGFDRADFVPDAAWTAPAPVGPIGGGMPIRPAEIGPMRRHDTAPDGVRVIPLSNGHVLIDLASEIVGSLSLTFDLPAACTVTLDYGEQLIRKESPDGTVTEAVKSPMNTGNHYRETWRLTAGRQTMASYGLMAFRYAELSGLPAGVLPIAVHGVEVRGDFDESAGGLVTDHPLLADIYRLTRHTVKVTTQDIYVDSQSRERGAYEGDLLINMLAAYAMEARYAPARFTADYLLGHRTWPADYLLTVIYAARADYMATGDARLLCAWYDTLKANLFTDWLDETGLIRAPLHGSSSTNAILVDWPPSERDGYEMHVPYNTVFNALCVRAYEDMAAIAAAVGERTDAEAFTAYAASLRRVMLDRLYDPIEGAFRDGMHEDGTLSPHAARHATAYCLFAGVYTDAAMAERLAAYVARDGKLHTSVYASFFLLDGLYRTGQGKIANRLLLDPDTSDGARTWAYMLHRLGATVTSEAWNETNKPNMTLSHPWGAAPAHLLSTGICGIRPLSPGYGHFEVAPAPYGIGHLDYTLPTLRGDIRVILTETEGGYAWTLTVPPNTHATIRLPGSAPWEVGAGEWQGRM